MRALPIGLIASLCALSACTPAAPTAAPIVLVGNQQTGDLYSTYVLPGEAARRAGNLNQDISDQTTALAQLPSLAAAHFERGHAYVDAQQWDNAIADLTAVIQQPASPQRPQSMLAGAYELRALAYTGKNQFALAITDDSQSIALDPARAGAWNNRCTAYSYSGNQAAALADCTKAVELVPNQPVVWADRAAVQLKLKRYDDAVTDNQAALKLDPKYAPALAGLAQVEQARKTHHTTPAPAKPVPPPNPSTLDE